MRNTVILAMFGWFGLALILLMGFNAEFIPTLVMFIAFVVAYVGFARRATTGSRSEKIAAAIAIAGVAIFTFGVLAWWVALILTVGTVFIGAVGTGKRIALARHLSRQQLAGAGAAAAILAVLTGLILAVQAPHDNTTVASPPTVQVNGQQLQVKNAGLDQPFTGDGNNEVGTPPVLNDGKGLITSWQNAYERIMALTGSAKTNGINNMNMFADATRQKHPNDPTLWIPYWNDLERTVRLIPGEFRVIGKVNTSGSLDDDAAAKAAVHARYPDLPDLQVVKVDGALVNTECGGGDCKSSSSPAGQFVDANGQYRIILTNPVQDKNGNYVPNIVAAEHGVGLGTECGNGFLGTVHLSPATIQKAKSATGNGSGTTSASSTTSQTTGTTSGTTTQQTTTQTTTGTTTATTTATTTPVTTTPTTTTPETTTPETTTQTTPPTTTETTQPKDTDPSKYTVIPSAPKATVTGPAAAPTTPQQPAGTTSMDAPAPPDITAPSASPTQAPTQPTGTLAPTQGGPSGSQNTGDVDPDGKPVAQPNAALAPAPQGTTQSHPVMPMATQPAQPDNAQVPTHASQPDAAAGVPASANPKPNAVTPPKATVADVKPTAATHSTSETGIIVMAVIGVSVVSVGAIGGTIYHRRRNRTDAPAHAANRR